ncbi:hypothetical protein JZ751_029730 [Albula glossodonta]|uniref:Ig-like domain-containing protein n=1 Tax=Albula glossodonta TaxID=121402 RepID=A0A8T2NA08_9TELE|nr:hypothetical protein JZ751_029730 [Albula glossodonta]
MRAAVCADSWPASTYAAADANILRDTLLRSRHPASHSAAPVLARDTGTARTLGGKRKPPPFKRLSARAVDIGHLPDNITVIEGESVILRCKIDGDVTHKAWLNRSNILFTGRDKWSLDPRVVLINNNDSDFSIQIDKVAVTDEGPYTCSFQARNQPRTSHGLSRIHRINSAAV